MTPPRWTPAHRHRSWRARTPGDDPVAFHRSLGGYAPTPITELPSIAEGVGVRRVVAKDESSRLGLPSFKGLGASWAIRAALADIDPGTVVTVTTATDGNHGRAVAHFARILGHRAEIFIPHGVGSEAIAAIEAEGARVTSIDGSYDDAVAAAARAAEEHATWILVQDTAWEGYTEIPQTIVDGYTTLLRELDEQLGGTPDAVLVPTGVGSLLQAVITHYRGHDEGADTAVVAVEPTVASFLPASLAAQEPVSVATEVTLMAGLNCGTPSSLAWPIIEKGLDGVVTVADDEAVEAGHLLADTGIDAGPCGAASLAGLRLVAGDAGARAHLRLDEQSTVALLITEGTHSNPLPERVATQPTS